MASTRRDGSHHVRTIDCTSAAVTARGKELEGHGTVLLVDALVWADAHPAPAPKYPGIELALTTIAQLPGRPGG